MPPGAMPEAFPLAPGGRYDYVAHFGLGGGFFEGAAEVGVVDAWRLGARDTVEVRVTSRYFNRTRTDAYTFVRTADWVGLTEKFPPDKVTFFLPTRLTADAAWQVETGEGTGTARVEAIEEVKVPAGRFSGTYRVRYLNPGANTDMTLWFAPGVGLVKADVGVRVNVLPLRGVLELEHFAKPLGGMLRSQRLPLADWRVHA